MPKVVDHEVYRLQLLEKAAPLFVEVGFEALTTRQLCRHLGVSTGTLYHYFESKERFFEAVAGHWMDQDLSWVREMFLELPPGPGRIEKVGELLQAHRQKFNTQNHLVLQYCQRQQQLGNDLSQFWDRIYCAWAQLTKDVLGLGSCFAGLLLCQVVDGVFMQWIQGGGGCPDLDFLFRRLAYWLPIIEAEERRLEEGDPRFHPGCSAALPPGEGSPT